MAKSKQVKQIVLTKYDIGNNDFATTKEAFLKNVNDGTYILDEGDKVFVFELKEELVYKPTLVKE